MLSGIVTLVWMLAFVAVSVWAWRPAQRAGFDDAARLAVDDAAAPADEAEASR
ncbi:MAG TPA: CcoQ/FixQ family Cbb3-type cytochrome c oxidase assembly chaperone [Xanthomonadaceae bacterium]|nr:CcoQ/FixQ family Cbb3-type cytochrome c oxidase assembly chaperone [Xanthomonadaceae bacterium]